MIRTALILAALAAFLHATSAQAACTLARLADLPVTMYGSQPMLHTKVNGDEALFVVDSGMFYSLMSPAGAAQLKLRMHSAPYGLRVMGVGGSSDLSVTTVDKFTLSASTFPKVEFLVGGTDFGGGAIGLLGLNFLNISDVDYDLGNGMIRLVQPYGCDHVDLAYWARDLPYHVLDIARTSPIKPHIHGPVTVNGVRMEAMFDTGAGVSVLSLGAARRAGVSIGSPVVKPLGLTRGVGASLVPTWTAPIASLDIAGEQIKNTKLIVTDIGMADIDLIIGADFFLSHHIYVSNAQRKLYFTYSGGQVFSLATTRSDDQRPPAAAADGIQSVTPMDADSLARRGAAFSARRDWTRALADIDKAIALKSDEPSFFLERAMAHSGLKDSEAAVRDLDASLKLQPNDPRARVMRAGLTLQIDRMASAKGSDTEKKEDEDQEAVDFSPQARTSALADLDAADKAAAPSSSFRLELASLYTDLDQFPSAVAQLDLWIASHPEDANMGEALNGRCWARALAGVELAKALADCNAALRLLARMTGILDSRGLVRLRRGEFTQAIADYDAVIAKDPKSAWSLYGRGLARLKVGKAAEGQADLAAAAKLAPRLPRRAAKLGLAP